MTGDKGAPGKRGPSGTNGLHGPPVSDIYQGASVHRDGVPVDKSNPNFLKVQFLQHYKC